MVEKNAGQRPDKFKGRKPVQVMLNPEEIEMVKKIADKNVISMAAAIRRAIYLQEWLGKLKQSNDADNLFLGTRTKDGELTNVIPVKLLPYT